MVGRKSRAVISRLCSDRIAPGVTGTLWELVMGCGYRERIT